MNLNDKTRHKCNQLSHDGDDLCIVAQHGFECPFCQQIDPTPPTKSVYNSRTELNRHLLLPSLHLLKISRKD